MKFSCIVSFRSFVVSDCTVKFYILFEWTFREKGKISFFFIISSFANISYWRGFSPTVTLASMRKISWHQVWGIVLNYAFCSTCLCVSVSGEQCCGGSTLLVSIETGECFLLHLCFVCSWSSAASYQFQECFSVYIKCILAVFDRACTESVSCFGF